MKRFCNEMQEMSPHLRVLADMDAETVKDTKKYGLGLDALGTYYFAQGNFDRATILWKKADQSLTNGANYQEKLECQVLRASACEHAEMYEQAYQWFDKAQMDARLHFGPADPILSQIADRMLLINQKLDSLRKEAKARERWRR